MHNCCMAGRIGARKYYVVVKRTGPVSAPFKWEIQRDGRAIGVNLCLVFYRSRQQAELAGKDILKTILNDARNLVDNEDR
jgi:hypothetical protein